MAPGDDKLNRPGKEAPPFAPGFSDMHDSTMRSIPWLLLPFLLAVFTVRTEAVASRVIPVPKNPADKTYNSRTLTPAQIADCLHREQSLFQRVKTMKQEEQQLSVQAARVQQMGEKLKTLEAQLKPDDPVAMDDFRFRVDLYRHAEEQYNTHAADFNHRLSSLKDAQQHYNNHCVDKQYYEDDYRKALASLKPDKVKQPASKADTARGIYLQLGAFRQQQSVKELYHRLEAEHLPLQQHHNQQGLTIVRAGPFTDMQEAERVRQHLAERYAIKAFVRKIP